MKKLLSSLFILFYLLIGFTPYLNSIDKIATQFLVLSIINPIITSFILINRKSLINGISSLVNNLYFLLYLGFIIISSLSYFVSINSQEVIIETAKSIIYFVAFINIFILLKGFENKIKFIPLFIVLVLLIENYLVIEKIIDGFDLNNKNRDTNLRAFTGNINITAFTMLYKFPFLVYAYNLTKNRLLKFLTLLTSTITIFTVLNFGSRGANLTIMIFSIAFLVSGFVFYFKRSRYKPSFIFLLSIVVPVLVNIFLYKNNDSINFIERTTKITNASSNQRLRFYKQAIETTIRNPFIGIGRGNWKIKSVDLDKQWVSDYTVPYHAHNDFLEISAETGIIGMLLHYLIFVIIFFFLFKSIFFSTKAKDKKEYLIPFLLSIAAFIIDSSLNFPLARPVTFIPIIFIVSFILVDHFDNSKYFNLNIFNKKNNYIIVLFFLVFSLAIIPLTLSTYKAYANEGFLMAAGRGVIKDFTKEEIFSIDAEYPNISGASVPIEAMKVNALINKEIFLDTMVYMLNKSEKLNPFLGYNNILAALYYLNTDKIDSAYKQAKLAYYKLPDHKTHFTLMMDLIEYKKDSLELEKAFKSIKKPMRKNLERRYLETAFRLKDSIGISERNIISNLKNKDRNSFNIFNTILNVGKENVRQGYYKSLEAEKLFSEGNYIEAGNKFLEASKFNPDEKSYIENSGNAFMQGNEYSLAIDILSNYLEEYDPSNGKAENLIAISYLGLSDFPNACLFFEKASQKSFIVRKEILERFCNSD